MKAFWRTLALPVLVNLTITCLLAAQNTAKDASGVTTHQVWPGEVETIYTISRIDSTKQPALYYNPDHFVDEKPEQARPLLVALHTWSGTYRQRWSLDYWKLAKKHGMVFIHPHFRGANNKPEATGSKLAMSDILDAVSYARRNANVDSSRIYLVGSSGGGYMALLMAGKHPDIWTAVSAWVPITDLERWYYQSKVLKQRYAADIENSCGGVPGCSDSVDYQYFQRSPIHFLTDAHVNLFAHVSDLPIDINAGIRDGHDGAVPIDHSLYAFNALADSSDRIPESDIRYMVDWARIPEGYPEPPADSLYEDHMPLLRRHSNNVRLTIFDGAHQGLPGAAVEWLLAQ